MRQQNQTSGDSGTFSGNTLLYTIFRHHHGLSHEQATLKVEATLNRMLDLRKAS